MSAATYRALRGIDKHLDEMARRPGANGTDEWRLAIMRSRAAVRVDAAAKQLAAEAQAKDAPAELRGLAELVRAGGATWGECLLGKVDELPEVSAWLAAARDSGSPVELPREEPPEKKPRLDYNDDYSKNTYLRDDDF
ncbi:hypothetical protein EV193_110135 [Herbihabitans rhizosphaerae]|uniref:Uncharacterized protein n=1 Tax=Herbihabitans rhizosphaerae TaxID=1872711 RepID=A0A4Q7KIF3_9PSEU|nr:hypothetical protein [Herbihabitans rhizosphaerae]RZS33985.1 hypothetical protein EV193_110135 [Herbihabitans rhizosphaerae]